MAPIRRDPYLRFASALIANAIAAARKLEHPDRTVQATALRAIAWLASPGAADPWVAMAGLDQGALVERFPLERWVKRGRELVAADPELRKAVVRSAVVR